VTAYDALVVGAGPAGASLALRLARAGRTCLLVDGARAPQDKVCGEGIMPSGVAALSELGLLERVAAVGRPFYGVRYRLPDGTCAQARFPKGASALGVRRRVLHEALLDAAEAEPNVDLRLGVWARDVAAPKPGDSSVGLRVGDERVEAPVLVGADGCRSSVRRVWGLDPHVPKRRRFGVRAHFAHAPGELVEVFVGGTHELYLTPVADDLTCVALLVDGPHLAPLQGRLEAGLRELLAGAGYGPLAAAEPRGRVAALGPLGLSPRAAHGERLMLVGDAGGAIDPITGEGVALALVTAAIAAEVLEGCYAANAFDARALSQWTRRRRRAVRPLAAVTRLVLGLSRRPAHAARVVRNLARSPRTFERLLGVASGLEPVSSLSLRDGVALALGM
jgi:2-polyprenyl-6-methoxyphenol hydroxylase-like FAD-dependent oxidoreductase